jgi:drug/metabolite transporter (DMT)-like permease
LSAQDLAAIRFGISGVCALPIVIYSKVFRTFSFTHVIALAATAGLPYVLLLYFGFEFAPASHGGVLVNGLVPAIVILYRSISTSSLPKPFESAGTLSILAGVILVVGTATERRGIYLLGDTIFTMAAFLFAGFLTLNARWKEGPATILLALSVSGAVLYLPIWALFIPKTVDWAHPGTLLVQALYQGILAPMVGMLLISQATVRCGPITVASILSTVPVLSAIMAVLWLHESISPASWLGICVVTAGILLTIVGTYKRTKANAVVKAVAVS